MSEPNVKYCREFLDGIQCHCGLFSEPPLSAPRFCRECQHGYSRHPEALREIEACKDSESMLQAGRLPPMPVVAGTSGKQRVLNMFNEQSGAFSTLKQAHRSSNLKGLDAPKTMVTADEAKDEALKGYRSGVGGTQPGNGRVKSKVHGGHDQSKSNIKTDAHFA